MEDLLALDSCHAPLRQLPSVIQEIVTPLDWRAWDHKLHLHPDQRFRTYIAQGIRRGFRLGFDYKGPLKSSTSNMLSTHHHPQLIRDYLMEETTAGRIVGPLQRGFLAEAHVSRFGLIPKKAPGEWRLIVDLSSPEGRSVNDGVYEQWCTLKYVSIEDALQLIISLGRGSLLAKIDIKKAYRNIPVAPADRLLLGMVWEGQLYIDATLPFGLCSAPKIFTAVADAAEWVARQEGVHWILHYLDDFLLVGPPDSDVCQKNVDQVLRLFAELGLPVAPSKLEGPTTSLCFLGIEIDTVALEVRLPEDKLTKLQELIRTWLTRSSCTKSELESLLGFLGHACCVVRAGKTFMRRLLELLSVARRPHHYLRLNLAHRSDLCWWAAFLAPLNHASFARSVLTGPSQLSFFTDAAGGIGCGAIWPPFWFQFKWPSPPSRLWPELKADSITFKELLPIVWGLSIWGAKWRNKTVTVYCDNQGTVAVVNAGYSKIPRIMHVLRCLFFIRARFNIELLALHIPGTSNQLADAISRDNLHILFLQVPDAQQCPLPDQVIALTLDQHLNWTSPNWRQSFAACFPPA